MLETPFYYISGVGVGGSYSIGDDHVHAADVSPQLEGRARAAREPVHAAAPRVALLV